MRTEINSELVIEQLKGLIPIVSSVSFWIGLSLGIIMTSIFGINIIYIGIGYLIYRLYKNRTK